MAHLPRWSPKICSDFNLAAFQQWLHMQDPTEGAQYLDLFIIEHADPPPPPFLACLPTSHVHHLRPKVRFGGVEIPIPVRPCQQPQCAACGVRGGYQFQWLGPWTCQAALRASLVSADSARKEWMACSACPACRTRRVNASTVFQAQRR